MAYDNPNYTQIPNLFLDQHLPKIKSLAEMKVTLVILRSTVGYHEREVELTVPDLIGKCELSRPSIIEGIDLALKRGTIRRRKVGQSFAYSAKIKAVKKVNCKENLIVKNVVDDLNCLGDQSLDVLKKERKGSYRDPVLPAPETEILPPYFGAGFIRALDDFEQHRIELKKPLKPTGRKALYDKLAVWDETKATTALVEATANGWTGVFEPKQQNGRGGNGMPKVKITTPEEIARMLGPSKR